MKSHSSNADVQENGCGALWYLALNDNNKVTIAEAGGITTILSAMDNHSSNPFVQYCGCTALMKLVTNNDNNKVMITNAGGEVAIQSAIRNHLSNVGVYEKGHEALRMIQPISTTTKTVDLSPLTTPTPSSSNSTDRISEGRLKMKEAIDNVDSRPIELPVEFIISCTNNFDNALKLGEGAFGAVYKGKDDNQYFAVKRILFDIAVAKDKVKEVSKTFKIELAVSSCVVSFIGCLFKA
jgi:hypothetical protein